jgi:hypothetical protein
MTLFTAGRLFGSSKRIVIFVIVYSRAPDHPLRCENKKRLLSFLVFVTLQSQYAEWRRAVEKLWSHKENKATDHWAKTLKVYAIVNVAVTFIVTLAPFGISLPAVCETPTATIVTFRDARVHSASRTRPPGIVSEGAARFMLQYQEQHTAESRCRSSKRGTRQATHD